MATILVLDDEPGVSHFLTMFLRSEGFDVCQAANGADGLRVLSSEEPDLIILDLNMPVMDGRTFYQDARLNGFDGQVVVCSAYGAEVARGELGANAAITKPFDPDSLLSIIGELLASNSHQTSLSDRAKGRR
jgi:DNA-binding response OmpR family regulator